MSKETIVSMSRHARVYVDTWYLQPNKTNILEPEARHFKPNQTLHFWLAFKIVVASVF